MSATVDADNLDRSAQHAVARRRRNPRLSVVIPVYNEVDSIPELWARLKSVLANVGLDHEVLFVDDGSRDGSLEQLCEIAKAHPAVSVLELSRNFGHQQALSAGIDHATGDAVVLMDADLQDEPELIPAFVDRWRAGFDVVYAVRSGRQGSLIVRALSSAFYRLQGSLADIAIPADAGIFGLLDRQAVEALRGMPESCRYLPGLRSYLGYRQTGVDVVRADRRHGASRVGWRGLVRLAHRGVFGFSTAPLRLVTLLGLSVSAASFAFGAVTLFRRVVFGATDFGWDFGLSTVLFMFGALVLALGIIGEYIGLIYQEVRRRPQYFVAGLHRSMQRDQPSNGGREQDLSDSAIQGG